MNIDTILYVLALILYVLAACNLRSPVRLDCVGFACLTLSLLV